MKDQDLPTSFMLGRSKYRIEKQVVLPRRVRGRVYPEVRKIQLSPLHSRDVNVLMHEITHAVLHDMGTPLWQNEAFVSALSKRMVQVFKTAEFSNG